MTDEEKKAIEYWKNYMDILHWNTQLASEHYMQVLLNLIEKQDKIIDLMAEKIDNFRDELDMLRNFEKDCFIPREYSDIDDCIKKESCKQCIIEYFSKKVGE